MVWDVLRLLLGPYPGWAALPITGILISPWAILAYWAWKEGRQKDSLKSEE